MWTNENRARYDRSRLRYPSDLIDAEWAHVEPLIPPAKRGGNRRHVDEREVVNGLMYVLSTGCQWRAIPKDKPPRAKQARPPPSSTARASRAQKKGVPHRPFGLRRWQEGQWQEAPHPGRYAGPADARHHPCRRRPGPRRQSAADGDLVRRLPVPDAALRRWRLSGAA